MAEIAKKSILIVDDEPICIKFYISALQSDYSLYVAKDGQSAINIAEKNTPDLILLDLEMPVMNGFEVITNLKMLDSTKDIPVIFVTGYNGSDTIIKGLELGAIDFIFKAAGPDVVKSRVFKHFHKEVFA